MRRFAALIIAFLVVLGVYSENDRIFEFGIIFTIIRVAEMVQ